MFGFLVRGQHGQVQIDDAFFNLALLAKGTVSVTGGSGLFGLVDEIFVPGALVYAIRPNAGAFGLVKQAFDGETCSVQFAGSASYGDTITYWAFGKLSTTTLLSKSDFGLRVSNDTGARVFDSRAQYAKPIDFQWERFRAGQTTNFNRTFSYSRPVALILNPSPTGLFGVDGAGWNQHRMLVFAMSGNNVTVSAEPFRRIMGDMMNRNTISGILSFTVLDVSGM
ncbi:MAG: hypothetical protein LBP58_02965 [Azoarcus sp.]|jgi:hypothetical protein|nr:hypothetical protein [Azoarcus sp.]